MRDSQAATTRPCTRKITEMLSRARLESVSHARRHRLHSSPLAKDLIGYRSHSFIRNTCGVPKVFELTLGSALRYPTLEPTLTRDRVLGAASGVTCFCPRRIDESERGIRVRESQRRTSVRPALHRSAGPEPAHLVPDQPALGRFLRRRLRHRRIEHPRMGGDQ